MERRHNWMGRLAALVALAMAPALAGAQGLKSLTLHATGGASFSPAFTASQTDYRSKVQSDIETVIVGVQPLDASSIVTLKVNGKQADPKTPMQATLAVGSNQIEVQVSDARGQATGSYRLVVERENIQPVVSKFERKSFLDPASGRTMPYRLFVPEGYDPARKYPLVVFLHGGGERGDDNDKPLLANQGGTIWAKPEEQAKRPAFVLVPQARSVWDGGFGRTRNAQNGLDLGRAFEPADDLMTAQSLLQQVLTDYPGIDRKRLYLTGLSQGGIGTWNWNVMQPDLFAAMVAVCGGAAPAKVGVLKDKPIWAFHAASDPVVPVDFSRNAIAAVRAAGGQPRYTEYDPSTLFLPIAHFSWVPAFQNEDMREWLFKQSR